jgi:hypothetical protein
VDFGEAKRRMRMHRLDLQQLDKSKFEKYDTAHKKGCKKSAYMRQMANII